jgi:hypothetical protein
MEDLDRRAGARVSIIWADNDTPGLCIEVRFCRPLPLSSSPLLEGFGAADVEVRGPMGHRLQPKFTQSVGPASTPCSVLTKCRMFAMRSGLRTMRNKLFPCRFPSEQGNATRDGFALDWPHHHPAPHLSAVFARLRIASSFPALAPCERRVRGTVSAEMGNFTGNQRLRLSRGFSVSTMSPKRWSHDRGDPRLNVSDSAMMRQAMAPALAWRRPRIRCPGVCAGPPS